MRGFAFPWIRALWVPAVVAAAVVAGSVSPTDAQQGATSPDASGETSPADLSESQREARAREHFRQGQQLVEEGECEQAVDRFEAGYELTERPLFLFNIAECARKDGDPDRARRHYERYLEEDPEGSMGETARARLDELPESDSSAQDAEASEAEANAGNAGSDASNAVPTPAQAAQTSASVGSAEQGGAADAGDDTRGQPVWKRWPLWAAVGAAVVAATVVPIAVTQKGGNGPSCGGDCQLIDFRDAALVGR